MAKLLPSIYSDARAAEALITDPNTPSDIRAQLEQAVLDAAQDAGINLFHPALIRQVFIEIFKAKRPHSFHHFENSDVRLLTVISYGINGAGPIDVAREDRATQKTSEYYGEKGGLEIHSKRALQRFVAKSKCREVCNQQEVAA